MDLSNKNITNTSGPFSNDFNEKVRLKVSDKFDPSIIGKIDLAEAEEIAKEGALFLTENDIMEGLEDFELVPLKFGKELNTEITQETSTGPDLADFVIGNVDVIDSNKITDGIKNKPHETPKEDLPEEINSSSDNSEIELDLTDQVSEPTEDIVKVDQNEVPADRMIESDANFDEIEMLPDAVELFDEKVESYDEIELLLDTVEILPDEIIVSEEKEIFSEDIIIPDEKEIFSDEIIVPEENELFSDEIIVPEEKEIFSDEIIISEEKEIFSEDIIVPEEKEIFSDEIIVPEENELFSGEIIAPEEIEAIIPDDKIRIIEELEDQHIFFIDEKTFIQEMVDGEDFGYFAQKKTQTTSEKPSILGLMPEENDYIKDKLFGEYYRKSDLNTDIDKVNTSGAINDESRLFDITDDIIILEDKEKLFELTSEFQEKGDRLVKLLSYLDGLFEKLPEGVIRKFAESEYFELYSKILRDIERLGKKKNESL